MFEINLKYLKITFKLTMFTNIDSIETVDPLHKL